MTDTITLPKFRRIVKKLKENRVPIEQCACSWCGAVEQYYVFGMFKGANIPICSPSCAFAYMDMLDAVEHMPFGHCHGWRFKPDLNLVAYATAVSEDANNNSN